MKRLEFIQEYILAARRSGRNTDIDSDASMVKLVETADRLFELSLEKGMPKPGPETLTTVNIDIHTYLVIDRQHSEVRCFKKESNRNIVLGILPYK